MNTLFSFTLAHLYMLLLLHFLLGHCYLSYTVKLECVSSDALAHCGPHGSQSFLLDCMSYTGLLLISTSAPFIRLGP